MRQSSLVKKDWQRRKEAAMAIVLKVFLIVAIVFAALFVLSLIIYFFNLDMKLSSLMPPILTKHYDKIKRKKRV